MEIILNVRIYDRYIIYDMTYFGKFESLCHLHDQVRAMSGD